MTTLQQFKRLPIKDKAFVIGLMVLFGVTLYVAAFRVWEVMK